MYLGKDWLPLTLGTAVTVRAQKRSPNAHLAEEDIMIGLGYANRRSDGRI